MEQDRIHIKLARRTPEERQADETRRLDPFMRASSIHTAATPETMNVEDLEKQRKGQELLGPFGGPHGGHELGAFELDGMNCAGCVPTGATTAAGPSSTATGAAIPAATWAIPVFWPPSWPTSPAGRCSPSSTASPRSTPIPPRWRTP